MNIKLDLKARLINAYYMHIITINGKPLITVDTKINKNVLDVPSDHILEDGLIHLNLSPPAIRHLNINECTDRLKFSARFQGEGYEVVVPIGSIKMIYDHQLKVNQPFVLINHPKQPRPPELRLV
jgi:stringent starvation protein B